MKYLIRVFNDDDGNQVVEQEWCYYNDCDYCERRFDCFTTNIIINNCINLRVSDIREIARKYGVKIDRLAEF